MKARVKSEDIIRLMKKAEELERQGIFDVDTSEDPPTLPLLAENITYLDESFFARVKRFFAFSSAYAFYAFKRVRKSIITDSIRGLENLDGIPGGAVITCNHFHPFDSFIIQRIFDKSRNTGRLWRVIREGNYTSFPGFYGFLMRNCRTLPLSSDRRCMHKFLSAVKTLLSRGDSLLVYPEQSLWYNYRKPKPTKSGAFDIAVMSDSPIVPIFITLTDSEIIGSDGFPTQIYTPHIGEPIYPDMSLKKAERSRKMQEENYAFCKRVYEDFYKIPLVYNTES